MAHRPLTARRVAYRILVAVLFLLIVFAMTAVPEPEFVWRSMP